MDAYSFIETDAATAEGIAAFISVATPGELFDMQEILDRRQAELELEDGQLVSVLVEGSTFASAWVVHHGLDPEEGHPQTDVFVAGSVPSLLLSAEAWDVGYYETARGPRLDVYVGPIGYRLRLADC